MQKILTELTTDELADLVASKVLAAINQLPAQASTEVKLLSRKETAARLHVTLPTLNQWVKDGRVKAHRVGRKVLFKSAEVDAALNVIKTKRS
jgi:excisionase family DNA binding protein